MGFLRRSNSTKTSGIFNWWAAYAYCVTGSMEAGESPREALICEAEEEVGLKLQDAILETRMLF